MKNSDYVVINKDEGSLQPNGFLNILALITRTGVFTYQRLSPDGTIETIRQLRHPDEVFSEETMSSLMGIPLTNNHPEELVTPENASDLIVGMSSDVPKKVSAPIQGDKEDYIQQLVTVFDADTIREIMNKEKSELSLGYSLELDFTPGVWNGQNYDAVQSNINYNHLALVKKARGGRSLKVILDGKDQMVQLDGETIIEDGAPNPDNNIPKGKEMKVFKHEGKEYEVDDAAYSILTALSTNLDSVSVKLGVAKKESDTLTAKCDEYKEKLKEQKDGEDKDAFAKAVKARVALEGKCSKVLGAEVSLDGLTERDLQEKVIAKVRPKLVLKDKSDDYVTARFEVCLEDFQEDAADDGVGDPAPKEKPDQRRLGTHMTNDDNSDDIDEILEKSKARSWDRSRNLYKGAKEA